MEQPAEKLTRRLEAELELTRDQRAGLAWLDEIDTAIKDIRRVYRPSLRCGPGFGPPKGQESGPSTLDGLLRKQGGLCFYCGRQMVMVRGEGNALGLRATLEHRFARSRGGKNNPGNLAASCYRCNNAKGDSLEADFVDAMPYTDYFRVMVSRVSFQQRKSG